MSDCTNCPQLQAQVDRLEAENQKLRNEILRLKRIIDAAEALCALVATEANTVLSNSQPKGVWAYNKGKLGAAERIAEALYY